MLEGNELGCTSAIEHEICITDSVVVQMHTSTTSGGGVCLTLGYAGCGGDMPQSVHMVQHGGTGEKERWITALLHIFLQT